VCLFVPQLIGIKVGQLSFGWALGLSCLGLGLLLKPLWSARKYVTGP
jgi:hypothetical protein